MVNDRLSMRLAEAVPIISSCIYSRGQHITVAKMATDFGMKSTVEKA